MQRVVIALLASALAAASSGCGEQTAKAGGSPATKPAEKTEPAAPAKPAAPVTPEALRPPAPTGAADDPRMQAAKDSTDVVMRSIRTIRERLATLRENYTAKVASAKDLKSMADGMGPLVAAARADCDLFLRVAGDVQHEFRYAATGYAAAARFYRERGRAYRDPELAAVNESLAANFDALARDVPRRARLTDDLIEQLTVTREFLADTDRCLRDSAAAFAALAAGPEPVTASPAGRAFKTQFEAFLAVVEDYLNALLGPPAPKPVTPAARQPSPVPAATAEPTKPAEPPVVPKVPEPAPTPAPVGPPSTKAEPRPVTVVYGPASGAVPVRYATPAIAYSTPLTQRTVVVRR